MVCFFYATSGCLIGRHNMRLCIVYNTICLWNKLASVPVKFWKFWKKYSKVYFHKYFHFLYKKKLFFSFLDKKGIFCRGRTCLRKKIWGRKFLHTIFYKKNKIFAKTKHFQSLEKILWLQNFLTWEIWFWLENFRAKANTIMVSLLRIITFFFDFPKTIKISSQKLSQKETVFTSESGPIGWWTGSHERSQFK